MTTSESKGRFFLLNESIRIANWNALLASGARNYARPRFFVDYFVVQLTVQQIRNNDDWHTESSFHQ